jgi:ABC-type sugar transport system ATPase subunit
VQRENGSALLRSGTLAIPIGAQAAATVEQAAPDGKVRVGVRATSLTASPVQTGSCTVPTEVYVVETFGYRNVVTSAAQGAGLLQAVASPFVKLRPKDTVWLNLEASTIHLFAPSGAALYHPAHNGGTNGSTNGHHLTQE